MKDIDPPENEEIYRKAEISIYKQFAPRVNECGHCGWPYPKGYICSYCGFDNSEGEL